MPVVPLLVPTGDEALAAGFDAIRAEAAVPSEFPPQVAAEAEACAARGPRPSERLDARDIELVTIDPPGSMDLDQALHIEARPGGGFSVTYAVADVGAFVDPGGAIDTEARHRAMTVYLPDRRSPLHPPVLSEGAASLLPEVDRPCLLWRIDLDATGRRDAVDVRRATARSRRRFTYAEVQASLDSGTAEPVFVALRDVGLLLEKCERERGGVSLPIPEQEIVHAGGNYELVLRAPLAVEGWNAQISLLTGMAAAEIMLAGGVGLLRTLPAATDEAVEGLRRSAHALRVRWPRDRTYGEMIRSLDARVPSHAALLTRAARLFRGAGYTAFDGTPPPPAEATHAAVGAPYAHVTAPLRRLVDRFANEVVLALAANTEVPEQIRTALPDIPDAMHEARAREGAASRMAVDLVEAAVLSSHVGEVLDAAVVDTADKGVRVHIDRPAVMALAAGQARPGDRVRVRVDAVDIATRRVELTLA